MNHDIIKQIYYCKIFININKKFIIKLININGTS